MARIAGVDLPRGKRIEIALTYIYGIGHTRAKEIITECGVSTVSRTSGLIREFRLGGNVDIAQLAIINRHMRSMLIT